MSSFPIGQIKFTTHVKRKCSPEQKPSKLLTEVYQAGLVVKQDLGWGLTQKIGRKSSRNQEIVMRKNSKINDHVRFYYMGFLKYPSHSCFLFFSPLISQANPTIMPNANPVESMKK